MSDLTKEDRIKEKRVEMLDILMKITLASRKEKPGLRARLSVICKEIKALQEGGLRK